MTELKHLAGAAKRSITRADLIARLSAVGSERRVDTVRPSRFDPDRPYRRAAVLVPIIDHPEGLSVLLTKRADHLSDHAGQVSFPGGRIEPDDPDAEFAALREAHEEVGIDPARVHVIGRLPLHYTGTDFEITPVVGLIDPPLDLRLDPGEVAAAFETPLAFVLDPANHQLHEAIWRDQPVSYYRLPYQDWNIWGATAMILVTLARALASE